MIASNDRRRISPRSRGAVAAQSAWADAAASSAARASSVLPSATSVITESSAGPRTSNLEPVLDSRHCPPMNSPREPVFAKRSSPVMDSACHWGGFAESVHVSVTTLTPLSASAWGLAPGTISSPSLTPCCEGLAPFWCEVLPLRGKTSTGEEDPGSSGSPEGVDASIGRAKALRPALAPRPSHAAYPLSSGRDWSWLDPSFRRGGQRHQAVRRWDLEADMADKTGGRRPAGPKIPGGSPPPDPGAVFFRAARGRGSPPAPKPPPPPRAH